MIEWEAEKEYFKRFTQEKLFRTLFDTNSYAGNRETNILPHTHMAQQQRGYRYEQKSHKKAHTDRV
jgi:hypothetical protein